MFMFEYLAKHNDCTLSIKRLDRVNIPSRPFFASVKASTSSCLLPQKRDRYFEKFELTKYDATHSVLGFVSIAIFYSNCNYSKLKPHLRANLLMQMVDPVIELQKIEALVFSAW